MFFINPFRQLLKSSINITNENTDSLIEEMGTQALNLGKILEPDEIEQMIDSINLHDFASIATKVMKGRGAMASVGKVHNVPYLEDLSAV